MRIGKAATRSVRAQRAGFVVLLLALAAVSVPTKQANAQVISTNPFHYYEHLGRDGAHILRIPQGTLTASSTLGRITMWLSSTSTTPTKYVSLYVNNVFSQNSTVQSAGASKTAVTFTFNTPIEVGPYTKLDFWIDLSSAYWKIWSASSTASNYGDCASTLTPDAICPYAYVLYGPEVLPDLPTSTAPVVTCGLTDLGCASQKALVWAFWPSDLTVEKYEALWTVATNTFPFNLIWEMPTFRNELFNTASSAVSYAIGVTTTIGRFDFISKEKLEAYPLSSKVKQVLGWLIWIGMVEALYLIALGLIRRDEKKA